MHALPQPFYARHICVRIIKDGRNAIWRRLQTYRNACKGRFGINVTENVVSFVKINNLTHQ